MEYRINEPAFQKWLRGGKQPPKRTEPASSAPSKSTTVLLNGTIGKTSASRLDIAGDNGRTYSADPTTPLPTGALWKSLMTGLRVQFTVTSEMADTVQAIVALVSDSGKAFDPVLDRALIISEFHQRERGR